MNSSEIRAYWDQKATSLKADPSATMRDVILRSLEIEAIGTRLRSDDVLFDVGTGKGYAALEWSRRCRTIVATDYSPKMIQVAREALQAAGRPNIRAEIADILD